MSVIHGRNVNIYNGNNVLIAAAKSCSIHKTAELIEVADPSNSGTKKYITGRTSWSISLSHLVTTNKGGIPMVGSIYSITYKVGSTSVFTGTAICTEAEITSTVGNLSQGSIKMQGSGPLSEVS